MVLLHSRQEHNTNNGAFSSEKEAPVHENDNAARAIAPTGSVYRLNAFRMAEMGYHPLPVGPRTKYPCIGKWQRYCRATPSMGDIEQYSRIPDAGVSLATGSPIGAHIMIAIDVDVEDGRLDLIADSLPYSPMEKIGRKGFTRFYRADPSVVTKRYDDEAGTRLIDLLSRSVSSDGKSSGSQTVIPPSIHPDTGLAYRWIKGPVPAADLPIFDAGAMARLEDTLAHFGWDGGHMPREVEDSPPQPSVSRDEDGSFGRELNDLAMANFEAWVPNLGLYGARPKSGGFEAVPSFRPSGSGRALEQRGRKLSFVASGIRDFGTGVGYTPIDLTIAALGLSGVGAIQWLKERLVPRVDTSDLDGLDALYYEKQSREAEARAAPARTPNGSPLSDELVEAKDGTLADAATGEIIPPRASLNGLAAVWDDREANAALDFEWLIKGVFPRCGVSLLWGQSGSGKSFVSLELAACIATGEPFFGNRTKATGGVMFALGEAAGTMPTRLNALRQGRFTGETKPMSPTTGELLDLDRLPFVWVPVDNLTKPASFAVFANAVRQNAAEMERRHGCKLRLVIVDTVVAAFGFEDDPDATKVTAAMKALDGLAQELGLLIVAVHHAGKSKAAGEHGSYAWRGSAETSIEIDTERDSVGVVKGWRLWVRKNRHGAEGFNRPFALKSVLLGYDADGEEISSAIVAPFEPEVEVPLTSGGTPAVGAGRISDAFDAAGAVELIATDDGRTVEAIRRTAVRAAYAPDDRGSVDSVDRRFARDLDRAIELGLIEKGPANRVVWIWRTASNDNEMPPTMH